MQIREIATDGYEKVVVAQDPESGLRLHCGVEHGADLWRLVFFHNCYLLFK